MDAPFKTQLRWFVLGLLALVALVLVVSLLVWRERERSRIEYRENLASWLPGHGGAVTYYDPADPDYPQVELSWIRQYLGDKPVRTVHLPFGFEQLPQRAKDMYPEALAITIEPVDVALARRFKDHDTLDLIEHAEKVEAFRIEPEKPGSKPRKLLSDYPTMGAAVPVPPQRAAEFSNWVRDADSYPWGLVSACLPNYGVGITFWRGEDRADVLLCFECSLLEVMHNGEPLTGKGFTEVRKTFVAAVKELFPKDKVIQGLR